MSKRGKCDEKQPCQSCGQSDQCSEEEKQTHEAERLKNRLFHIRHKIMVMSGKGGVGKTTVAINLAAILALEDYRVGILDADIHGPNIPLMLGVDLQKLTGSAKGLKPIQAFPNLKVVSMALLSSDADKPIIWRGPMKHKVIQQFLSDVEWGDLDYLIIDLPPGTGDEPLSIAHLIEHVDGSIIVTTPQEVALLDSRKAASFSKALDIPVLGIVENMSGMVCPHCGKQIDLFKVGGGEKAARELKVPFLGRIPIEPEMVRMCDDGKPLVLNGQNSPAYKALNELAMIIYEQMEYTPNERKAGG
jgi:Mrp family chromosome partitioning ATPase